MAQEQPSTVPAARQGPNQWIGKSVPKIDSLEKAVGSTKYVGDIQMAGMLHARILWAGVPHAVIRGIDTSKAKNMPGIQAVLTAADLPGVNRLRSDRVLSLNQLAGEYGPAQRCHQRYFQSPPSDLSVQYKGK